MRRKILSSVISSVIETRVRHVVLEQAVKPPSAYDGQNNQPVTKPVDTSSWATVDAKTIIAQIQEFRKQHEREKALENPDEDRIPEFQLDTEDRPKFQSWDVKMTPSKGLVSLHFPTELVETVAQDSDDEFDIPGLDGIDERVDAMRSGGGEIVEDSGDGCEGGACKI